MRPFSAVRAASASTRSLSFPALGERRAIDVLFDGARVWSTTPGSPGADGIVHLVWPKALRPHLRGRGLVTVRDSASGEVIAETQVRWRGSDSPLRVMDAVGRRLVVNKWDRLGPTVEGSAPELGQRLLENTEKLLLQLLELGYVAYICSGTLLGAVRNGELLPHDDDADVGVLLDESNPVDLSLASFRLEDQLAERGYLVVRHSSSHLQLVYLTVDGRIDHYIDIFIAFYRGADFCQPFHIRTPLPRSSVVPVSRVTLGGRSLPAPAIPADWLAACYGPNWQTPDPSFKFETPLSTRRRFRNWFGSQNGNRSYWENVWGESAASPAPTHADRAFVRLLTQELPPGAPVLDLGCGAGVVSAATARTGHAVLGVDFSFRALALARTHSALPEWRDGNVYNRRRLLELGAELVRDAREWHVALHHLLDVLTVEGRANVFLLLREILDETAFALASIDTNFITKGFAHTDPQTWHLPVAQLEREAAAAGFTTRVVGRGIRRSKAGIRRTATVLIRRMRGDT